MNLDNLTPDEWWDNYESMSEPEQYDFIKKSIEQGLPPEFAQEIDLSSLIYSIFEQLIRDKQYNQVLELQVLLNKQKPEALGGEMFYADSIAIEVQLFKEDRESLRMSLNSFIDNPVKAIDMMLPIVDKLKYYGYGDIAEFLSKEVYRTVRDSDKLIRGAEKDFATTILMMEYQNLYNSKSKGLNTDREDFVSRLKLYDFDEKELGLSYDNILADENNFSKLSYEDFYKDKKDFFQKLFIGFSKYAFDNKNINFPTAEDIWTGSWAGFCLDSPTDKSSGRLDSFFKLNKKALYEYVRDRFGFLSNKKPYAFAVLWGMPYVYDFLKINLLINDDTYSEALEFLRYAKMELIEGLRDSIWKYDFVHTWFKPDSSSAEEFDKKRNTLKRLFTRQWGLMSTYPMNTLQKENHCIKKQRLAKLSGMMV